MLYTFLKHVFGEVDNVNNAASECLAVTAKPLLEDLTSSEVVKPPTSSPQSPNMRVLALLASCVSFYISLAVALDQTVDIFAWPISAPTSQTLARISYNATAASVQSYTAPKISDSDDIVRVGFHHPGSSKWSGVATAASNFAEGKARKLQLHLNTDGELYHVGFIASDAAKVSGKVPNKRSDLAVEIVTTRVGQAPYLNKPIVLDADGKVESKEPEKSFLQK